MNLRLETAARESLGGNGFDREYWKTEIKAAVEYRNGKVCPNAQTDEDIYIVQVKRTLQNFLRLSPKDKKKAAGTRRFMQAYECLFYGFSTLPFMKAIFNEQLLDEEEYDELGVQPMEMDSIRTKLVEKMVEARESYGLQGKYVHFNRLLARYKKPRGER